MSRSPGTHSKGKLTDNVYVPCNDYYVKPNVVKNVCRGSSSKNGGGEVLRNSGSGRDNMKGKGGGTHRTRLPARTTTDFVLTAPGRSTW